MTLDEAIVHAREVASVQKDKCEQCAKDHEQLAKWLEELKGLRQSKADVIDEFFDLIADEIDEAERYARITRNGILTIDEIYGCVESAKEKLKEKRE